MEPVQPADPREAAWNLKLLAGLTAVGVALADTAFLYSPSRALLGVIVLCTLGFLVALCVWRTIWCRRCWTIAESLTPGSLRDGRGLAAGAWFIPLANLWLPRRVLLDIRRASGLSKQGIVNLWWSAGIVAFGLSALGGAVVSLQHVAITAVSALVLFKAGVFIRLVSQVTDRQVEVLGLPAIRRPGDPVPESA
jgi:hypothetical protein